MPPIKPKRSHMVYISGEKIDAAMAADARKLPTMPTIRQPHLLHRAEARGASIVTENGLRNSSVQQRMLFTDERVAPTGD